MYPDMRLKSVLERDKLSKTMIFFQGVYDTLDLFTDSLIEAFSQMGMETFVYHASHQEKSKEELLKLLERSGDAAVVTFNNLGYNLDLADGRNIWDVYNVPYVDILMDHPFHYGRPLSHMPETAVILCTDKNHVAYIRRFFPNIRKCGFLPHAGVEYVPHGGALDTRKISVLYAGALPVYTVSKMIPDLHSIPEVDGEDMAQTVLAELVHHPYKTTEQAIEEYVRSVRGDISDERLHELIVTMRFLDSYATSFFREQAVRSLVENGISVTAYGVGWNQCEWSDHPNLIYGGKVLAPQILPLMNDSKIVLNTLTWFKAGAHDRIFNGMLAQAAVVTDDSTYLNDIFTDGQQLSMFCLEQIRELPEKVHELLSHPKQLQELADRGYEAARTAHTWKNRAQEICTMME